MNRLLPLMQREWLQHRFGWALMVLIPLGLALALVTFGSINIGAETAERVGDKLPALLATISMAGTMLVMFVIAWFSSTIIVSGLARRDHSDRSVEFWLSLPTTHSASFAAPLIVHLLIVPIAALLIGLTGGFVLSMVTVVRVLGFEAWLGLPWGQLLGAIGSLCLRFIAGLPLAELWLLPLTLLIMLLTAWFRRWGWVILIVGVGLGSQLLERLFGHPMLSLAIKSQLKHALQSFIASEKGLQIAGDDVTGALQLMPSFLLHDMGLALRALASPLMLGGLLFSAACFWLLLRWRQRGASVVG